MYNQKTRAQHATLLRYNNNMYIPTISYSVHTNTYDIQLIYVSMNRQSYVTLCHSVSQYLLRKLDIRYSITISLIPTNKRIQRKLVNWNINSTKQYLHDPLSFHFTLLWIRIVFHKMFTHINEKNIGNLTSIYHPLTDERITLVRLFSEA